ncbi:MAG: hypothetical protein U0Q15_19010 [Kineosporiaceae bacterium]
MLKTKSSRWSAGAAGVCVLLLVATWFLLISPRRSEAADLRDQTTNRLGRNDALNRDIAKLKSQAAQLPQQQAQLAAIKLEMPEERNQAPLLRKMNDLAEDTGVDLIDYSQGVATQVTSAGAAPAAAATPSPGTTPASGAAPSTPSVPQGVQLYSVPTTVTVHGDYFVLARFLKQLQTEMIRAYLIGSVAVKADTEGDDGEATIALSGQVYVLRTADSAPLGSTPSPTPTPSVTPTATPTGTPSSTRPPRPPRPRRPERSHDDPEQPVRDPVGSRREPARARRARAARAFRFQAHPAHRRDQRHRARGGRSRGLRPHQRR